MPLLAGINNWPYTPPFPRRLLDSHRPRGRILHHPPCLHYNLFHAWISKVAAFASLTSINHAHFSGSFLLTLSVHCS